MVSGRQVHTLTGQSGPGWSVAFSPNGKHVISGSEEDNLVRIWDTDTGALVSSFVGVRSGWRVGPVIFRAFSAGFGLREGGPGEWRGVLSRLEYQEGLTEFGLRWQKLCLAFLDPDRRDHYVQEEES